MRNLYTSKNPAVKAFEKVKNEPFSVPMTIDGTVSKSILLMLLALFSAVFSWKTFAPRPDLANILLWVGLIGGLVVALITTFKPHIARYTAVIYALLEGLALGVISVIFETMAQSLGAGGLVFQAVLITFAVLGVMLLLYKFRILRATKTFVKIILIATAGIFVFYLVDIVYYLFTKQPLYNPLEMGIWGIVIQLVIVGVAALNLILDFDFIEQGAQNGLPKYMEWFGAFSLMVTLVWLYIEILKLLFYILMASRD